MNEILEIVRSFKYYFKGLKASDNTLLISQIGLTYGELGDLEEGIKFLKKAYEMGRDDIWLNSELGWQLSKNEQHEEAIKHLKRAGIRKKRFMDL